MTELIQSLRDAPVMNLFVLVGFLLVVLAAVGRAGRKKVDTGGRVLSGTCGVGLLAAATVIFLGLEKSRSAPSVNRTPPGSGELRVAPATAPEPDTPAFQPKASPAQPLAGAVKPLEAAPPSRRLLSDPVTVRWGCGETVTGRATLVLPPDVRLVSAKVLIDRLKHAKAFERGEPTWDRESRICTGAATFEGLDRIFLNCPGDGEATMRIEAVVTGP